MELISLYYFSEVAKDLHITRTADRLYVTQQTLSNHIARLEDYYGMPLFYRRPKLSLTTAGERVLAFANSVGLEHANLRDSLSDIEKQESGVIHFGASILRLNTSLPHVLPEFSARYPKVELRLTEGISSHLLPMVVEGRLDFAIVLSDKPNPKLTEHHLMDDHIYLCVSDVLLRKYYGDEAEAIKRAAEHGANVKDFAKLPFCMLNNLMGDMVRECFQDAQVTPWQYISCTNTNLNTTGAAKAVGEVIPELQGRMTGMSFRVPTTDVSVVDLTARLKTSTNYGEVCRVMEYAATHDMKGIITCTNDPVVSSDLTGFPQTCIFDEGAGIMLDDNFVKCIAWYDNEWGYTNKLIDLITYMYSVDHPTGIFTDER